LSFHAGGVGDSLAQNERTITQRLMELAPESAAAHCGQSILGFYDWDFPSAERHIQRAIQIGPAYELGHTWDGFMLENWMRPVEARRQLEIARKLNPSKVQIYRCLAHTYYVERNFPYAIELESISFGESPQAGGRFDRLRQTLARDGARADTGKKNGDSRQLRGRTIEPKSRCI
jgi:hypothetical protein